MINEAGVTQLATTAVLAMLSVGLWTVRVAVTARGNLALGALVAAVEATTFAVAFSRLLAGLDSPTSIAAYAFGVGLGTVLGLKVDARVNPQSMRVDVTDPDMSVERALDAAGWPNTATVGKGVHGSVSIVSVTVEDGRLHELIAMIQSASPNAFWTVSPVRRTSRTIHPPGYLQVAPRPARTLGFRAP
jgi:uncharacterized protein YebE (UPF0316 family)